MSGIPETKFMEIYVAAQFSKRPKWRKNSARKASSHQLSILRWHFRDVSKFLRTLLVSQIRKMLFILGEDCLLWSQLAISYAGRPRLRLFFYLQVIHSLCPINCEIQVSKIMCLPWTSIIRP